MDPLCSSADVSLWIGHTTYERRNVRLIFPRFPCPSGGAPVCYVVEEQCNKIKQTNCRHEV